MPNTYPTISNEGRPEGWAEAYQNETVVTANYASGYPFRYADRTFDGVSFKHELRHVTTVDKNTLKTFYVTNKAAEFWWWHEEEEVYYLVVYAAPFISYVDQERGY